MEIRPFEEKDAKEVSRIIHDCYLYLPVGGHTKRGIELQLHENSPKNLLEKSKRIHYFVGVEEDKIIGIGGYNIEKVHTVFVDRYYQKKGYGRQILSHILSEAKKAGIMRLKAWSLLLAVGFYEHFGFVKVGEFYLPEGTKDILLIEMEKKL